MRTLLFVLPYAGLVLSAFSVIWGLTHELTTKDENNKRHLTTAGRYSVAFVLLGLFVSFNTGVLKTITDNQEAQRKGQQEALEKLERQQQEEAREERQRNLDRETQAQIDREAQKSTARAITQKQSALALSQQQIQGFNKAERFARLRTLGELQRSNRILWDVRRSQYPFTNDLQMDTVLRVSIDQPALRPYAAGIETEAKRLFELHKKRDPEAPAVYGDQEGNFDLISVSRDLYLFNPRSGFPALLRDVQLGVSIFRRGDNVTSLETKPDIGFVYAADIFGESQEARGTISYSVNSRSYRVVAPRLAPSGFTFNSSGRMTSLLDFAGATLVIDCRVPTNTGCSNISLESIRFELPPGIFLNLKGFKHETLSGQDVLVHRFDSDGENFFEKYATR